MLPVNFTIHGWTRIPCLTPAILVFAAEQIPAETGTFPVAIQVQADRPIGEWKPIWRFFGADEPNYACLPDGRKLLGELGALKTNEIYFRTHNLLTSGDGTPALKWGSTGAYTEDPQGNPVYHWTILDRIFDATATTVSGLMWKSVSCRKRCPPAGTVSTSLDAQGKVQRNFYRLGLPAEGLREMVGTGFPVDEARCGTIRERRSEELVLGNVE